MYGGGGGVADGIVNDLGGRDNSGHACTGMCADADEVEIVNILGAVVGTEPGALRENRLEGKGRAEIAVQCVGKVAGTDPVVGNEVGAQVRHPFRICAEVEGAVAVIEDTVEGVAWNQLQVALAAAFGRVPDLAEDPRRGDHSGTGVEGEAVDLVDIGAAAQFVPFAKGST